MDTPQPSSFAQFVPQLFYDLIARIVAGAALLLTAFLIWPGYLNKALPVFLTAQNSVLASSLFFILAAYLLALLLEGLWWPTVHRFWAKKADTKGEEDAARNALEGIAGAVSDFDAKQYKFPAIPVIYDLIRLQDPVAGARLVKLRAEVQLCRTLALGWLLALLCELVECTFNLTSLHEHFLAILFLTTAALLIFLQYVKRRHRACWSLYNHWLLLVNPGLKAFLASRPGIETEKE